MKLIPETESRAREAGVLFTGRASLLDRISADKSPIKLPLHQCLSGKFVRRQKRGRGFRILKYTQKSFIRIELASVPYNLTLFLVDAARSKFFFLFFSLLSCHSFLHCYLLSLTRFWISFIVQYLFFRYERIQISATTEVLSRMGSRAPTCAIAETHCINITLLRNKKGQKAG